MADAYQVPPHSLEAEQAILGGLMLDNKTWHLIADQIRAEDFYRNDHRMIFKAIADLADRSEPFDIITISEALEGTPGSGGLGYICELAKNTPSVANIEAYARVVADRGHLRRLISIGHDQIRIASQPSANAQETHEQCEQALFALGQRSSKVEFRPIADVLSKVIDQIDHNFNSGEALTGLPSDLPDLDEVTAGFQPSDLIIVAGRPSMGKTALALNWVAPALRARPQHSVQIYSLEMPADKLVYRLLAGMGRIDLGRLLKGQLEDEDWSKLSTAVAKLQQFTDRLMIDDTASISPADLRARARRAAKKYGPPALILVDYLQLMRCPGMENRTLEIGEISRSLKALAKEHNCPVVALSQLNRELERRPNKRPVNADLRESGAIEQDADLIMFVYRDEVYHPESELQGIAELIIGKHRNGPIGTVRTAFIAQETRFAPLAPTTFASGNFR
ncbi:MAG TPA: replicative DNA helicase [Pseudomonas sp.]|jgi:replicative DNA helicase